MAKRFSRTGRIPATSENKLVHATIHYLNAIGHFAYRTHNYPVFDRKLNLYRKHAHHKKGLPDIHVLLKGGRYAVIETKGTGKQSDEQKVFQVDVERRGGIYILAFNIDEVMKAFPSNGGYSGSIGL